jgi:hypothetical protein
MTLQDSSSAAILERRVPVSYTGALMVSCSVCFGVPISNAVSASTSHPLRCEMANPRSLATDIGPGRDTTALWGSEASEVALSPSRAWSVRHVHRIGSGAPYGLRSGVIAPQATGCRNVGTCDAAH